MKSNFGKGLKFIVIVGIIIGVLMILFPIGLSIVSVVIPIVLIIGTVFAVGWIIYNIIGIIGDIIAHVAKEKKQKGGIS